MMHHVIVWRNEIPTVVTFRAAEEVAAVAFEDDYAALAYLARVSGWRR